MNGLTFARQSNVVTDAVPGCTLTLNGASKTLESATLTNDAASTQTNIQTFVTAYNAVAKLIQAQLNPTSTSTSSSTTSSSSSTTSTPDSTLDGDATINALNQDLQSLTTQVVPGLGSVATLADLGVSTQEDGTLSIDQSTLANALATNPTAVNSIFTNPAGGLGSVVWDMVFNYTAPASGMLTNDQSSLSDEISQMNSQETTLQQQVSTYQDQLSSEFAAMESISTKYQNISAFLTAQSNAQQNSNNS